jgi:hypothetical protein
LHYEQKNAERLWGERLAQAILLERVAMDEAWRALEVKYRIRNLRDEWEEIVQSAYVRLGGAPQW